MTESILQTYLNEQHIKTDAQENIESLRKAVKDVEKHLIKKKINSEFIPFTLVALDPMVKASDPVVEQVETIIIKNWPTFKNCVDKTNDKSITYVRAVILESLYQLSKEDAATAALVWLTARDVIRYYQLDGEGHAISQLLQKLADRVEENGRGAWGISQKLQVNNLKEVEISIPEVDGTRSLDQLSAAVSMALDLAEQVEPIYPESVDYLLREALKDAHVY